MSANDELSYLRGFEHITLARILIDQGRADEALRLLARLLAAAQVTERMKRNPGKVVEPGETIEPSETELEANLEVPAMVLSREGVKLRFTLSHNTERKYSVFL